MEESRKSLPSSQQNLSSKIFIAIPNMGWIQTGLMLQLIRWSHEFNIRIYPPQLLQPVSYARNFCIQEFLKTDYDYLMFIDSDMIPPHYTLQYLLNADKDAITGVAHALKRDSDGITKKIPITLRWDSIKKGYVVHQGKGIEQIDVSGLYCILIKRKVLDRIKPPWTVSLQMDDPNAKSRGEDFYLCEKMAENGFKLFADYRVVCGHYKEVVV